MIKAIKIAIQVSRKHGIRTGLRNASHYYYWVSRTRW